MRDRLQGSEAIRPVIDAFDKGWPHVRTFRNGQEHILGPHGGVAGWYFRGGSVVRPTADGSPEYLVDARHMDDDLDALHRGILDTIDSN